MAAILGGGGGGADGGLGGAMGQFPLEQWFFEMPICTRLWTTATIVTGVLVQCQILTPFQLFYSWRAVWHKQQVSSNPLSCRESNASGGNRRARRKEKEEEEGRGRS
jgi:Derlin-2/3